MVVFNYHETFSQNIKMFDIDQILSQLYWRLENLKFQEIVRNISQIYEFRYDIQEIKPLCKNEEIDNLVIGCYKGVSIKIICDIVKQKKQWTTQQKQKNQLAQYQKKLDCYSSDILTSTKNAYFSLLKIISDKISQRIEFILFLIYLSSEPILVSLVKESRIIGAFMGEQVMTEVDKISIWTCMIANFYTTGLKISSIVYGNLKKKYLAKDLKDIVGNNEEDFHFLFNQSDAFHASRNCKKRSHLRTFSSDFAFSKTVKFQKKSQAQQLQEDLNKIFSPAPSTFKLTKNNRRKTKVNTMFFNSQSNKANLKQSNRNFQRENKQMVSKAQILPNKNINRKIMTSRIQRMRKSHQDIIFSAFSMFGKMASACKNKTKPKIEEIEKNSLQQWKKKIKNMRNSTNIQFVSLKKRKIKRNRQSKSNFQQQRDRVFEQMREKKKIQEQEMLLKKMKKQAQQKTNNFTLKGFTQHIDVRQPNQIKIVKDIVNYTNYSPQKKPAKHLSRKIMKQMTNFIDGLQDKQYNFESQNNYNYRLQMALSGCNKF